MPDSTPSPERATVLVVAGLDPSGGAGIALDAAVIRELGLHPLTVLTGVAVQNTESARSRHDLSATLIRDQLETLAEEFLIGAVKAGMLGTVETVRSLAAWLEERPRLPLVLDPVLSTTSGGALGETGLGGALSRHLLPRVRVLTPNLDEAGILLGRPVDDRDQVPKAAEALRALGPRWVLIKGGHLARDRAHDYLAGPEIGFWLEEDPQPGEDVRGTGCALASALAAGLARGESVPDAARAAKAWVTRAREAAYRSGRGRFLDLDPRPE